MDGLKYEECLLGNSIDTSVRRYLEMDESGPIVWTWQLQDPSNREEQETWIPLNMNDGKLNIQVLLISDFK
jgi:hypothetical protein